MPASVMRVEVAARGKPRPRFTRNGKVCAYTPHDYQLYERMLADEYVRQGGEMHGGFVAVTILYRKPLPPSKPGRVMREWDGTKPDLDNVAKAVLDALNGVAFTDDSKVVKLDVRKMPRERKEPELIVAVRTVTATDEMGMIDLWQRYTRWTRPSTSC